MISPAKYDLKIYKGATFNPQLTWQDCCSGNVYDLTAYSAKMQIRITPTTPDPAIVSLTSTANLILTNVTGSFNFGDEILGNTSRAVGYVVSYNTTTLLLELSRITGIFQTETLENLTSGATATISSINTNGGIILGSTSPNISFFISAAATEAFSISSGVYDLFITDSTGITTKLLYGKIQIYPNVTE